MADHNDGLLDSAGYTFDYIQHVINNTQLSDAENIIKRLAIA